MDALRARYPFLSAARETVQEMDIDLGSVATTDDPVVDRARNRVQHAMTTDTVGQPHRSPRVELLSYPIARVLVSLIDEPLLLRRYAHAEANTAYERFTADLGDSPQLQSVSRERITLDALLAEFTGPDTVVETANGFAVGVATYLRFVNGLSGDRWRLVHRELADGNVPITRDELYELLRSAIRARVESDLPLTVPDEIASSLAGSVTELRDEFTGYRIPMAFDVVDPERFPPCTKALIDRVTAGDSLAPHSWFSLTSFLSAIGMATDEIVELYVENQSFDETAIRAQLEHFRSRDRSTYPSPSCETMQAYGDCVNMDSLCEEIDHPLVYYERRLDDSGEGDSYAFHPESQ